MRGRNFFRGYQTPTCGGLEIGCNKLAVGATQLMVACSLAWKNPIFSAASMSCAVTSFRRASKSLMSMMGTTGAIAVGVLADSVGVRIETCEHHSALLY